MCSKYNIKFLLLDGLSVSANPLLKVLNFHRLETKCDLLQEKKPLGLWILTGFLYF